MFPKIYLAIDNCFASKRWTTPEQWASVINEIGIKYVESSADTECDMLYSDRAYLENWKDKCHDACEKYGLSISSVYTGHGTYSTLGLTHTDKGCRERMLEGWMYSHIDNAAEFGAIVGFYCHAFDDSVLQSKDEYSKYLDILYEQLYKISNYCKTKGVVPCLEQMYSPRQYPWRIKDGLNLISKINSNSPFYITIDTGHQTGQHKYNMPTAELIKSSIINKKRIYVGADMTQSFLDEAIKGKYDIEYAVDKIYNECLENDYLFSELQDGKTDEWLSKIGTHAPIVHLQQTNGLSSSHWDFSDESNKKGIITGEMVLNSLYKCFINNSDRKNTVDKIYLTLEMFYSNTTYNYDVLESLKKTVDYWRRYIPTDGINLEDAVSLSN